MIILLMGVILIGINSIFFLLYRKYLEQKRYIEELQVLANIDRMTGALNREAGLMFLQKIYEFCRTNQYYFTICFIDVDNLKWINDTFGHMEGDRVIKIVYQTLRNQLRECDIVFRFGGDEFVVVLPKCSKEEANKIWKRIEEELDRINHQESKKYEIGLSHGFSEYDPKDDKTLEELLQSADTTMYKNKQNHMHEELL